MKSVPKHFMQAKPPPVYVPCLWQLQGDNQLFKFCLYQPRRFVLLRQNSLVYYFDWFHEEAWKDYLLGRLMVKHSYHSPLARA